MSNDDYQPCEECYHDLDLHYTSKRDRVRCLYVERGTSTRGIIGLSYEIRCDCIDGKSASAEAVRAKDREEKENIRKMVEAYKASRK